MRNRSLNSQMAGSAKSNEIVGAIGGVPDEEASARSNMVNIERTPVLRAASANATFSVAIKYRKPNAAPVSAKFKIASAAIIWMSWANHRLLGASIRTEFSTPMDSGGERAECLTAMKAGDLLRRDAARPAALKRTMTNIAPRGRENPTTGGALNGLDCVSATPVSLTLPTAKPKLRLLLLHEVMRPAECFTAICALIISVALHHRRRVACPAAIHHGPIIGLETLFALEARLVH